MHLRIGSCIVVLAAVFAAGPVSAQQNTVAKLINMEGSVLVSQGDAMVAGANDLRLPVGARVVTTGNAKVTINYDAGCDVRLNENQRFTVRIGPCGVLLAEVEALGPAAGAIGGGTAGATTAGAAGFGTANLLAAGAVIGIGVYETFKKNNISPN